MLRTTKCSKHYANSWLGKKRPVFFAVCARYVGMSTFDWVHKVGELNRAPPPLSPYEGDATERALTDLYDNASSTYVASKKLVIVRGDVKRFFYGPTTQQDAIVSYGMAKRSAKEQAAEGVADEGDADSDDSEDEDARQYRRMGVWVGGRWWCLASAAGWVGDGGVWRRRRGWCAAGTGKMNSASAFTSPTGSICNLHGASMSPSPSITKCSVRPVEAGEEY